MTSAETGYLVLRAIVLVATIACLFTTPKRFWPIRALTLAAIAAYGSCIVWTYQIPYDFNRFWQVGRDLAAGLDYYGLSPTGDRQLILNPPTVLPLFRAWACLSLRDAAGIWTALNAIGGMALVPLAYRAFRAQMGEAAPKLPRPLIGLLSAALGMSAGQWMGMALGQVSVLAVAAILAALWAQGAKRPGLAGLALSVATIKANTLVPFLGLFLRREDRRGWVTFSLGTAALCLATGPPAELPKRCATTLATIRATFEPGRVNDYSYGGESHVSLVGLDHALYRIGLHDRNALRFLQATVLAGLCGLTYWRLGSGTIDRAEACAALGLIGGLFFYHRIYDEVLMALPVVYGALRASSTSSARAGDRRRWASMAALALLVVYVSPDGLRMLETASFGMGRAGGVVRGLFLPLATWLIVLAFVVPGWKRPRAPKPRDGRDVPTHAAKWIAVRLDGGR
jgi:hypothetical protein